MFGQVERLTFRASSNTTAASCVCRSFVIGLEPQHDRLSTEADRLSAGAPLPLRPGKDAGYRRATLLAVPVVGKTVLAEPIPVALNDERRTPRAEGAAAVEVVDVPRVHVVDPGSKRDRPCT